MSSLPEHRTPGGEACTLQAAGRGRQCPPVWRQGSLPYGSCRREPCKRACSSRKDTTPLQGSDGAQWLLEVPFPLRQGKPEATQPRHCPCSLLTSGPHTSPALPGDPRLSSMSSGQAREHSRNPVALAGSTASCQSLHHIAFPECRRCIKSWWAPRPGAGSRGAGMQNRDPCPLSRSCLWAS